MLVTTADGEEYFELNKDQPGVVLTSKNHKQEASIDRKTTRTAKYFLKQTPEDVLEKSLKYS